MRLKVSVTEATAAAKLEVSDGTGMRVVPIKLGETIELIGTDLRVTARDDRELTADEVKAQAEVKKQAAADAKKA